MSKQERLMKLARLFFPEKTFKNMPALWNSWFLHYSPNQWCWVIIDWAQFMYSPSFPITFNWCTKWFACTKNIWHRTPWDLAEFWSEKDLFQDLPQQLVQPLSKPTNNPQQTTTHNKPHQPTTNKNRTAWVCKTPCLFLCNFTKTPGGQGSKALVAHCRRCGWRGSWRWWVPCFGGITLLGQWLNFKLFGITYLVGKIKFKLFFSGSTG